MGENLDYIKLGHAYPETEIKVREADNTIFLVATEITNELVRSFNSAVAFKVHVARVLASSRTEIEQNNIIGPMLTFITLLTQRDGDFITNFDLFDGSVDGINSSSLKQVLINNQTEANRGVIRGHLPLESNFEFRISFEKFAEDIGFELQLKKSNRKKHDILYTLLGDEMLDVTISSLSLYTPTILPSPETQRYFNEAITKNLTFSLGTWTTDRRAVNTGKEFELDISSSSKINVSHSF